MSELTDAEIESIIEQNDDTDHPDATTVERVHELLDAIQECAEEGWFEYVDNIEDGGFNVIAETDTHILFDTGEWRIFDEEIDVHPDVEYRDDGGIESSIISQVMHERADKMADRRWPATYPIVVRKPDGFGAGQRYVEAVINGLQSRGITPGQAWAYYGVEIQGNSQSKWARRQDRDQSQVSKALKKARSQLP